MAQPKKQAGKNGKNKKKGVSKQRKTPTLKQKLRSQSKIVRVDQLKWKPVDIPDNLDDYEGFFGLEEIDGVDVKMVNGRAEFIMKESNDDESDKEQEEEEEKEEEEEEEEEEVQPEEEDEQEDEVPKQSEDSNAEEDEFTGFEDVPDNQKSNTDSKADDTPKKKDNKESFKHQEKTFQNLDINIPDDNISLPQWEDQLNGLSLSSYTLTGLSALGFDKPTPIQRRTIPIAIEGKDVIGKATTGSGKTLAYGIPILEKFIAKTNKGDHPTGIIFTPTRELAHQVVDHLNLITKFSPLSANGIVSVTGGLSIQKQERLLSHSPGILVATPGRFLELLQKDIELVKRMAKVDVLVLDEADRLLQDGHFEEFEKILELLRKHRPSNNSIPWKWQTLVFSATFSKDLFGKLSNKSSSKKDQGLAENDEILQLLNSKLKFKDTKPALIDANPKEIVAGLVTEALVECGPTERDLYLYYFLLMYPGTTLVFANAIDSVKRLVPFLNSLNIPAFSIHSSMIQKQRLRALEKFKHASENNQTAVLIASDVAARGLDIPNIDHVVHYHLPRSADVYIHRSGRTARAGKEGVSIMLCSPNEASGPLRKLRRIVANSSTSGKLNMHNDVKLLPIEADLVTQIRPRVSIASKLADSSISTTATRKEDSWVKQAAEDLGVEDLGDLGDFEDDMLKKQRKRKEGKLLSKNEAQSLRYELKELLSKQLRKNPRRSYLTSGLENLAHQMVTGHTHKEVLGHAKVNALDDLRKKGSKDKKFKVNKPKANPKVAKQSNGNKNDKQKKK
ncbi:P-loop containing nucleoside triphosphate hydrolase protein [Scheffersomyces amazonensis]|uniref:P-loop containing nucleoside triphosphate hydrolase protein n=1 Tax=Scheffersomyces amazonensis TaxID=1078765 RepID=UPI00315D10A6